MDWPLDGSVKRPEAPIGGTTIYSVAEGQDAKLF